MNPSRVAISALLRLNGPVPFALKMVKLGADFLLASCAAHEVGFNCTFHEIFEKFLKIRENLKKKKYMEN